MRRNREVRKRRREKGREGKERRMREKGKQKKGRVEREMKIESTFSKRKVRVSHFSQIRKKRRLPEYQERAQKELSNQAGKKREKIQQITSARIFFFFSSLTSIPTTTTSSSFFPFFSALASSIPEKQDQTRC